MKKLLLILLLAPLVTFGRKFYFSTSGSDGYTSTQAQNPLTPWKSLAKLQSFATSAVPGDTFAFKCGDVFIGPYDRYGSVQWGSPFNSANSGTATAPIVFTSYGTGDKPNFLFPTPSTIAGRDRIVFAFDRTNYLVFDNLQFNDYRFSVNDKVSTCLTKTGLLIGEETAGSNNIVIKNCLFNNIGAGIEACGNYITIQNNTFNNLKNFGDTATQADIGCVPMSIASGKHYVIKNNYIKGGWGFSGATASGQGLNGVGIELVNDIDSSFIAYNTIIDCAGGIEYGNITGNSSIGMNCDTFAYNKFINNGNMAYLGISNAVCSNLKFWNNVYVENQYSRFSGPRFGTDIYGDGQSFSSFPSWPTWPKNPTTANFGGFRMIQYPTESTVVADTLVNSKNNIAWLTTGLQIIYSTVSRPKYFHTNNIYHITGANTVLGGTLTATEKIINTKLFVDSSSNFPENWNFSLVDTSSAVNGGAFVGLTSDFAGNPIIGIPDIGILELQPSSLTLSYTAGTILCNGGSTTVIISANGGVPPYTGTGSFTKNAGNYVFKVTDSDATTDSIRVLLTQPTALNGSVSFTPITVNGGTTTVTVTATGGTGSKTYSLDGGSYQSGTSFAGVAAGNHTITIKDANSCTTPISFIVTYNSSLKSRLKFIN